MKRIILILLLICSFNGYSQKKFDSKVIVTVTDTNNLVNKIVNAFYEKDYPIDTKDVENGFVSTKEQVFKHNDADIRLRAKVKGNTVIFSGDFRQHLSVFGEALTWNTIMFSGVPGSVKKSAFVEMEAIAKSLGGTLSYSK